MFEVVIKTVTGETETYDALDEIQATNIFFRARQRDDAQYVEINEVIEADTADTVDLR